MTTLVHETFTAAAAPFPLLHRVGESDDWSYGIYTYGFVVEQTASHFCRDIGPVTLAAMSIVATLPLAPLSWRYVEQPAHEKRHVIGRRLAALVRRAPGLWLPTPPTPWRAFRLSA